MMKVMLPASMEEFLDVKKERPDALVMAGGTDLLVKLRENKQKAKAIIILERIKELSEIKLNGSEIIIGAMATHQQLMESPIIAHHIPCLGQAAGTIGSPAIRHMGTIGGNICTASPAGDTLGPLYVMQAKIELTGPAGSRVAAIEDFIQGPGRVNLMNDEILKQVRIPVPDEDAVSVYYKVGQRKALAISICSMAVFMQIDAGQRVQKARIAWGSVGPTVMRFPEIDARLEGRQLSASGLSEYGQEVCRDIAPISDIRASAAYRRMLVANLPLRLLLA